MVADMLFKCATASCLCLQYRLAQNPKGRFPAAVQDAVTAYRYLLSKGISTFNIVLSDDLVGGNLMIALLQYLVEYETKTSSLPRAV